MTLTAAFIQELQKLESLDSYRHLFSEASFWLPAVRMALARFELPGDTPIRAGVPGTYPTFIVGDRWVVKFFGRLFNGSEAFQKEIELYKLLSKETFIPTPRLISMGQLLTGEGGWPWPYLITTFIPGKPWGELSQSIPGESRIAMAGEVGRVVAQLHSLPLPGNDIFPSSWDRYVRFLTCQVKGCDARHQAWGSLPIHLVEQIQHYLLPVEDLIIPYRPPHLIHADITHDHLLGYSQDGKWITTGLIDFGDAMVGSLYYELIALHLDLFGCDRSLLSGFFHGYGYQPDSMVDFAHRAMCATLLHEFDVFVGLEQLIPHIEEIQTLEELADIIWGIEELPGGR